MGHGGKRLGAGRREGAKGKRTLEKEALRHHLLEVVAPELEDMLRAHVAHAKGMSRLVIRDKGGKYKPVTTESAIAEANEIVLVQPSPQSLTILLAYLLDRPKEQPQEIKVTGELTIIDRLQAARKRAAAR